MSLFSDICWVWLHTSISSAARLVPLACKVFKHLVWASWSSAFRGTVSPDRVLNRLPFSSYLNTIKLSAFLNYRCLYQDKSETNMVYTNALCLLLFSWQLLKPWKQAMPKLHHPMSASQLSLPHQIQPQSAVEIIFKDAGEAVEIDWYTTLPCPTSVTYMTHCAFNFVTRWEFVDKGTHLSVVNWNQNKHTCQIAAKSVEA